MTSCRELINKSFAVVLLVLSLAIPAKAQEKTGESVKKEASPTEIIEEKVTDQQDELASDEDETPKVETHTLMGGFAGYRFLSVNSDPRLAAPYEYLHSSPVGGGFVNSLGKALKLGVEGVYNNEKDFNGDLLFDYKGDYRVHLRTESFFHNLDHELLFFPPFTLAGTSYTPVDLDPAGRYGVKTQQDLAAFRLKLHDFPFHVNLGYWRMDKEGNRQLIFADQSFEGTTNFIYSANRPVERQTQEGNIGFDAHLGYLDLIYNFKIRQFKDNESIPISQYGGRPAVIAGLQQHNEDPDSRFTSHTIKLHTSLAGGFVGAASYTYGRRENLSGLTDVRGADQAVTTLQNIAGDATYTPCGWFSLAVKYRRQEVDNSAPLAVINAFAVDPFVAVRPALETSKDTVTVTMSARPDKLLTIKGEYKGEFLHRENVTDVQMASSWYLPDNNERHTGTVSILSRPIPGLKLKALYSYSATIHPSYGTSFAERHEGQLLATYNKTAKWGLTANYRVRRESNDQLTKNIIVSATPLEYFPFSTPLGRGKSIDNATASFWFTPMNKLNISASYGFLRSSIDQAVLFTIVSPATADASNYTSQSQVYSINAVYQMNEKLDLSLMLQQVRFYAEYSPQPLFVSGNANTAGIGLLSRTNTVESSLSLRANYSLYKSLSCVVDYTYRDYDEKTTTLFNGSVNSIMAYLSAKW